MPQSDLLCSISTLQGREISDVFLFYYYSRGSAINIDIVPGILCPDEHVCLIF